jgi:AcrR family transcriptional regulator
MVRSEEANQRIRSIQHGRILDAARTVFARKGLSATMDDVAEEAGVSHGLAYRYFANKTALVSELVIEDLQAPVGWLVQFANESSTPSDKIRQMVTGLLESRRDHPEQYQLLAQVLYDDSAPADLRDQVAERRRKIQAVLRHLIAVGQATGEVAPGDPDQLVRAVLATLDGLTDWQSSDPAAHRAAFPDAEIILRMLMP